MATPTDLSYGFIGVQFQVAQNWPMAWHPGGRGATLASREIGIPVAPNLRPVSSFPHYVVLWVRQASVGGEIWFTLCLTRSRNKAKMKAKTTAGSSGFVWCIVSPLIAVDSTLWLLLPSSVHYMNVLFDVDKMRNGQHGEWLHWKQHVGPLTTNIGCLFVSWARTNENTEEGVTLISLTFVGARRDPLSVPILGALGKVLLGGSTDGELLLECNCSWRGHHMWRAGAISGGNERWPVSFNLDALTTYRNAMNLAPTKMYCHNQI